MSHNLLTIVDQQQRSSDHVITSFKSTHSNRHYLANPNPNPLLIIIFTEEKRERKKKKQLEEEMPRLFWQNFKL